MKQASSPSKPERWTSVHHMQFSKAKCKVLHVGQSSSGEGRGEEKGGEREQELRATLALILKGL